MPFFEDFEADEERLRQPIWGTFALLTNHLERLVAINVAWSLQLLPALAALAFPQLPALLRLCLFAWSVLALPPATALLFVWVARLNQGEPLELQRLGEDLRRLGLPSLYVLGPLPGLLALGVVLIGFVDQWSLLWPGLLLRLLLLGLLFSAPCWGPLFALEPATPPWVLLGEALRLAWRYPLEVGVTALLAGLLLLVGLLSVAGCFLIVPALLALLLTRRCQGLLAQEQRRRQRWGERFKVGLR